MVFETAVMLDGCPCCGDDVPKIVTYDHVKPNLVDYVNFVGDWEYRNVLACRKYGMMRIISCRPIDTEDEQGGAR